MGLAGFEAALNVGDAGDRWPNSSGGGSALAELVVTLIVCLAAGSGSEHPKEDDVTRSD